MNKVHKYWMNFNLLVFLGILLLVPFVPYIKLKSDDGAVLSESISKPLPAVISTLVVEASPSSSTESSK